MKIIILLKNMLMITALVFSFGINAQVINGDFESWTDGAPDGWTTIEDGTVVTQENTILHGGTSCANFNVITDAQGDTDFRQSVDVVAGTTYNVSFWTYHTEGGMRARLYVGDYLEYTDPLLVDEWQEMAISYLATETGSIQVGLRFYDLPSFDGEETVYIDDFVMDEIIQVGPNVAITSPTEGAFIQSADVTVSAVFSEFVIGEPGSGVIDGYFSHDIDGTTGDHFTMDDFVLTGLADGAHTLTLTLLNEDGNPLVPSSTSTVNFEVSVPTATSVANITELRAGTIGEVYMLTGEAILTYQQGFRNQKYIQDADAGILIDDNDGAITTTYGIYDGITGLVGTLGEFGNMMQFVPLADAGTASSIGNDPVIVDVTFEELTNNFDAYEARLVNISSVTLDESVTFENGTVYGMNDGTTNFNFRTTFYNVNYIGEQSITNISLLTAIPNSRNDGDFVTPRNLGDFQYDGIEEINPLDLSIFPNPSEGLFTLENGASLIQGNLSIYDLSGRLVHIENANLSPSESMTIDLQSFDNGIYIAILLDQQTGASSRLHLIKE